MQPGLSFLSALDFQTASSSALKLVLTGRKAGIALGAAVTLSLAMVGMLALVRDLGLGQHSFRIVESSQGMSLRPY